MPCYVLTGAPGSGKTTILRQLEVCGHRVVEEAATDVIALRQALGEARPWHGPAFIDQIVNLQRQRRRAVRPGATRAVFFDRSPVCTLALSRYLARADSPRLRAELERVRRGDGYERTAFFVRNQGFVRPTEARRITFDESLVFERIHEQTYRELGFDLVEVPAGPLAQRTATVLRGVERLARRP